MSRACERRRVLRAKVRRAVREWAKRFNDGDYFTVSVPISYGEENVLTNTNAVAMTGVVTVSPNEIWQTIGAPPADRVWLLHLYGNPQNSGITLEIPRDEFLYSGIWLTSSMMLDKLYG